MKEIKDFLLENADEKHRDFHVSLTPGLEKDKTLGIKIPVLRKFAKELSKKGVTPDMVDNEYFEETVIRGMLIGFAKYPDFESFKAAVEGYIPYIDSWGVCDIFCGGLKQTKKFLLQTFEFLLPYAVSEKEYEARFAAVMLLSYFINDEYIDKTLETLYKIKQEDYYAKMAVAWAYSVAFVKFYDKTKDFILTHDLDKFTHNKAIQKACESYRIDADKKDELRRLKKS
ncbi:MAG: DNA alkylation repair protein [Firmicutes bacterium]|nr:DNA alkylation repair protein [Bacillota bacterium]